MSPANTTKSVGMKLNTPSDIRNPDTMVMIGPSSVAMGKMTAYLYLIRNPRS